MKTQNHGVHTERGLRPDLEWTILLSPPGDAGRYSAEECRLVIVGLNSNSGGESFTFEFRYATDLEVVVSFTLVAPYWSCGDLDLESTVMTAELPLSKNRLSQLRLAIDAWLDADVSNADLLNGKHQLAAAQDFTFDCLFGRRDDLISSNDKPVVSIQYKLGKLCGEFALITDQSCLRDFAKGLRQLVDENAE